MIGKVLVSVGDNVLIDFENSKFSLEDVNKKRYKIFFNHTNIGYIFSVIGRVDKPYLVGKITSKKFNIAGKLLEIILTKDENNKKLEKIKNKKFKGYVRSSGGKREGKKKE